MHTNRSTGYHLYIEYYSKLLVTHQISGVFLELHRLAVRLLGLHHRLTLEPRCQWYLFNPSKVPVKLQAYGSGYIEEAEKLFKLWPKS